MKSTLWWLGLIFGTLSVVMLIEHGFEVSFVSSLQVVLDLYHALTAFFLRWAEPLLQPWVEALSHWTGWKLHLYEHWRDFLVLMMLYIGASASEDIWGRSAIDVWAGALFRWLLGAFIAVASSVAAGVVPLTAGASETQLIAASVPIIGLVVFMYATTFWDALWFGAGRGFWTEYGSGMNLNFAGLAVATSVLVVGSLTSPISNLGRFLVSPVGLTGIFVALVSVVHFFFLAVVAHVPSGAMSTRSRSWSVALREDVLARMSLRVFTVSAAVALFLTTNAGLKLADL